MKNKQSKKKKYIILGIVLAVVIVVIAVISIGANRMNRMNQSSNYEVVAVTEQNMQLEIRGSGSVESMSTTDYFAPVALKVNEVYVENGSEVTQGDAIAKVDASTIKNQIDTIEQNIAQADDSLAALRSTKGSTYIKSPVAGTIKIINVNEGDSVEAAMNTHNALIVMSADEMMRVTMDVADTGAFSEGSIVYMAAAEEQIEAVISKVDALSGTVEFVVEDDDYEVGTQVNVNDADGKLLGTGTMSINVPIYVSGSVGVVEDIRVDVNDEVSKNNKLISLEDDVVSDEVIKLSAQKEELLSDLDKLNADLDTLGMGQGYTIYASQRGIVSDLTISDNATAAENMKMFSIQVSHPLKMQLAIDELEIAQVKVGQTAEVTFEALPGRKYTAQVTSINPVGQSVNNVTSYYVTITLDDTSDILIGMSGTADILSELKQSIITIPLAAVQIIDDEYYVILGEDAAEKTVADHKITVGVSDGTNIEVVEGLNAGDTVTVPIKNQNSRFGGFGGANQTPQVQE